MEKRKQRRLWRDLFIVMVSVVAAWLIVESRVLDRFILSADGFQILNSFVAGLFFTSAFTTAPAIIVLAKIGQVYSPYMLALIGGTGALVGDLILFNFMKGHVSEDVAYLFSKSKSRFVRRMFQFRITRILMAVLGAVIIASPLPDELGLALMGLSNVSMVRFAIISFTFNAIGIFAIAYIARAI
jgi:uncharacterized membrane protein YdjX (TVP38/TMEM64 family)